MKKTQGIQNAQKFVPIITTEGIPAKINPDAVPVEKWNYHHGKTAAGLQVNSMKTAKIGNSLLIQGNAGPTLSVTQAEFEVAATQFLAGIGYTMKAPGSH